MASQLFQEFRLLSIVLQDLEEHNPRYPERRRFLLGKLFDIGRESELLAEVKDILDEIKIIETTLRDQRTVIESSELRELEELLSEIYNSNLFGKPRGVIREISRGFEILRFRAQAAENSVGSVRRQ